MRISRAYAFVISLAVGFLLPAFIPSVGIDDVYFFIIVLVLFAWFSIKWTAVKNLNMQSRTWEIILGGAVVVAIYGYKIVSSAEFGILDYTIVFSALALTFYGVRSFRLFWVPAVYGIVLLLGYQIEALTPNYVILQDWLAGVMASAMTTLGITTSVSGHIVYLNSGAGLLALDVEGDCTGVQGILSFGLLSTMAVLDVKPKLSRLIPIFAIGFVGAFLINIARLFMVFVTFQYLGVDAGTTVHVYLGYVLFIVWVMVFWSLAFRYLAPMRSKTGEVFSTKPLDIPQQPST